MAVEPEELEMRLQSLNYKHWRSNSPFLYDLVMNHQLTWPSLTVQWLPWVDEQDDYSIQHCLLGTHTSDNAPNHLMIMDIAIPSAELAEPGTGPDGPGSPSGFEALELKYTVACKIPHDGEVHKARYMPQRVDGHSVIVATKKASAEVHVFDTQKYDNDSAGEGDCRPDLRLMGHKDEGYGLAWNSMREGLLLSGSDDCLVVTWDLQDKTLNGQRVRALNTYEVHTGVVEDVAWHGFNPHIFGSVGDDKQLILWDTRKPPRDGVLRAEAVHEQEVNSLAFNPANPHLLATSSSDTTVALRDWRCLTQPLHVLQGHTDQVFQIAWCPQEPTVLGSAGTDCRVMLWDITRIGAQQSREEADDGPPELLFVHAGQSAKVQDFSWNTNSEWVIASTADDNNLQVWQVAECIRGNSRGQ